MIVADASAVIDVLLDPSADAALTAKLSGSDEPVSAPDLLDVEVLSVLRRWERRRELSTARARQALDDFELLPIVRQPARVLLRRAWALRHALTAYDAQYVGLAVALSARLVTTDARMAAAARGAGVKVD